MKIQKPESTVNSYAELVDECLDLYCRWLALKTRRELKDSSLTPEEDDLLENIKDRTEVLQNMMAANSIRAVAPPPPSTITSTMQIMDGQRSFLNGEDFMNQREQIIRNALVGAETRDRYEVTGTRGPDNGLDVQHLVFEPNSSLVLKAAAAREGNPVVIRCSELVLQGDQSVAPVVTRPRAGGARGLKMPWIDGRDGKSYDSWNREGRGRAGGHGTRGKKGWEWPLPQPPDIYLIADSIVKEAEIYRLLLDFEGWAGDSGGPGGNGGKGGFGERGTKIPGNVAQPCGREPAGRGGNGGNGGRGGPGGKGHSGGNGHTIYLVGTRSVTDASNSFQVANSGGPPGKHGSGGKGGEGGAEGMGGSATWPCGPDGEQGDRGEDGKDGATPSDVLTAGSKGMIYVVTLTGEQLARLHG